MIDVLVTRERVPWLAHTNTHTQRDSLIHEKHNSYFKQKMSEQTHVIIIVQKASTSYVHELSGK